MKVWRYGCAIERLGGRYRLDGSLGSGGMADVYLAWDEREKREVAIKIMKTHDLDQQTLNRFLKEASQVVGWNYPHILRVYEDAKLELLDAANGSIVPYIVMEYVTGGDLHKRLKPGQPYPLAETLRIFAQLCSAVQYAHERNVIHRDLKPLNILFRRLPDSSEQVVLSDFGLAVKVDATHHTFAHGGTLAYMAPEQFRGQAIRASDIFALGVILYQLCTGKLPFRHSLQDFQHSGLFETPERPSVVNPSLPKTLDDAILKAIAEDPVKRFTSALLFWEQVRLAMMPPPAQQVSPSRQKNIKEDTRPLADPLLPATRNVHNSSQVPVDVAMELVSLSRIENNPDLGLVESSHSQGEHINQLPASTIMPVSAFQLSAPPSPIGQLNTVPIPTIPDLSPEASVVSAMQAAVLPPPIAAPITPLLSPATKQQNNDGVAVVGTANGALGVPIPAGGTPSTGGNAIPTPSPHGLRGKIGRRWLISVVLILLVLLLVFASVALIAPNLLGWFTGTVSGGPLLTTITITPVSKDLKNTYAISAVLGTPDPARHEVQARLLFSTTPAQSKTVNATGTGSISATEATGFLTFYNSATFVQSVAANTVFIGTDRVEVVNDERADIPAARPPVEGSVTVTAHAVKQGLSGNISALDINAACCLSGVTVQNVTAFSGGQDAQIYTYVLQSDIDGAANTLESSLTQIAQTSLQKQIHASEQLVVSPQCQSHVTSNHAASDRATNVTVNVAVTCQAEVYDHQGVVLMTEGLLKEEASNSLGVDYSLVGNVITAVIQATVEKNETASLLVNAEGVWVYQFSDTQKQNLVNLIKGKSQNDAQGLLLQQPGVSKVTVNITSGGNTLPTDPTQIRIVVQPVQGVKGTVIVV